MLETAPYSSLKWHIRVPYEYVARCFAVSRKIQDLSRDCQLIDEDEYAAVNSFGRGPTTAGPPAAFGQAAPFSAAGGGTTNGTSNFNVRFVASTAQPVNSNSGSSATSPSGGSSTGYPVVRVFAQDSPSTDAVSITLSGGL
ncbi:unnamed protein product [Dibothriocephalus latus]|uniref:Uncharacterized protein n=1 Tax=Dibothriocephalus latus TaxID=60516 RepID=A0A3P7PA38_DIBLA|nr:unnamed protein product [Dibothriocephalus latus]